MEAAAAPPENDMFEWPQKEFEERYFLKRKINWLKKKVLSAMEVVGVYRMHMANEQPCNTLTFSQLEEQSKELKEYVERIPHINNAITDILEMVSKIHQEIRSLLVHKQFCDSKHEKLVEKLNMFKQQFNELKKEKKTLKDDCERWCSPSGNRSMNLHAKPPDFFEDYFVPGSSIMAYGGKLEIVDECKLPLVLEIQQLREMMEMTLEFAQRYKSKVEGICRLWIMFHSSRPRSTSQNIQTCRELGNLTMYREEFIQQCFLLQEKFNIIWTEVDKFFKVKEVVLTQKKICDTVHVKLYESVATHQQGCREEKDDRKMVLEDIYLSRKMYRHVKNREAAQLKEVERTVIPVIHLPESEDLSGLCVECSSKPIFPGNHPMPVYKGKRSCGCPPRTPKS